MEPMVCAWCQCEPNACMTEPRPNLQKNVVYVEFQPRYSYEKHVELVPHWAAGFKIVGAFFPKKRTFFIIILREYHYGKEQRKTFMTNTENDGEVCNAACLGLRGTQTRKGGKKLFYWQTKTEGIHRVS